MVIRDDEYRCYGFELVPSNESISKLESIEGHELMDKTKNDISFLGVHDTGKSVLFIFVDNQACKKYMGYYKSVEKVRYVGECAIKKSMIS